MSVTSMFRRKRGPELQRGDVPYLNAVQAAQVMDPAPAAMWAVYLLLLAIAVAVGWASMAQVDIVATATGRVVPDGREQVIASLEGGILREMLVREGQEVAQGQALATLDPTRFESQQAEGTARKLALQGTLARLHAEANGSRLQFPDGLPAAVVDGETESHEARQRVLNEAVETSRRSAALLARELAMAESMSAKGLMSEVEVMRVRRQVNDLQLQTQERINRARQEAAGEMVRVRNELALLAEQMVVRDDALRRTTLVSPVRGVVKTVRANTVGGVIAPGAPVMELLPIGPRVLVEARVKPADIGFVKTGQPVKVKLSAYEYAVYGALEGAVVSISPDAMGDPEKAAQPEGTWYRAMVRADPAGLRKGDKPLPVLPGMTGSVEIRTGQRSVLGFLLRPMMKSQEAFRER
ncbi:MAG: HlyD family type I secretion periplasmic adaptor subunit [Leptothrix sp. (in: Bacteria)]|nr:HlyD family type I secretion periplasmic adaptor subunit [Leptothrix sp. (in: b-proteobacteria)]